MTVLFVYGTLMRGFRNHSRLGNSRFLGPARTQPGYRLIDLGRFPGLLPGNGVVSGELYEVDHRVLECLDEFEGIPTLFDRREIGLDDGRKAEAYFFAGSSTHALEIDDGDYRQSIEASPA